MSNEERKIYDLVVRRFISVLYPACEYEETSLTAQAAGETFAARGKRILSSGWRAVYEDGPALEDDDTDSQNLPQLKNQDRLPIDRVNLTSGKTKPPARFTEATLLSAMENPARYMESNDAAARRTLGETGGLGTVATRADIIEKLFHSFLIEKKGQEIFVTSKGKQLLALVPEDLKKPELTADWEMRLARIARGEHQEKQFLQDIESYTKDLIREIKTSEGTFRHDNLTNAKCPRCGKRCSLSTARMPGSWYARIGSAATGRRLPA